MQKRSPNLTRQDMVSIIVAACSRSRWADTSVTGPVLRFKSVGAVVRLPYTMLFILCPSYNTNCPKQVKQFFWLQTFKTDRKMSTNIRFTFLVLNCGRIGSIQWILCASAGASAAMVLTMYEWRGICSMIKYIYYVLLQHPQINLIWIPCLVSKSIGTETINHMSTPLNPPSFSTPSLCMSIRCLVVNRADIRCTTV